MNFKKTISVAAVAAMAMSVCAVSAYAVDVTTTDEYVDIASGGAYLRLISEESKYETEGIGKFTLAGLKQTDVYGVKIVFSSSSDVNLGVGGGFGFNSNSTGWKSLDWGNKDSGKAYVLDDNNTLTYMQEIPIFSSSDKYVQLWAQQWWGDPVNVDRIIPLDKNGNEIDFATAIKEKEAEEAAAAETEAEETTAEVPADTTEAVEETTEATVEEEAEEEVEEETEEETEEEEADVELSDEDVVGIVLSEGGTSSNWGQAVVLRTYAHIEEGEEVGDDAFDPSLLNEDSVVVVTYEADTAPELILQSWSGGEGWAKVPQNEEYSLPGVAVFTYDYMIAMYGDDFSTLDALNIGDTGSDLTVTSVSIVDKAAYEEALNGSDEAVEEDAEEEAEEVVEEAPAADTTADFAPAGDSTSTAPTTGNNNFAAIAGIFAIAGAAAVALKKRK